MTFLNKEFQIRNIAFAAILISGLIQILFLEYTSLENGLGYDGGWYIDSAKNIFAHTDNYHVLRLFPSFVVWVSSRVLRLLSIKNIDYVLLFQFFNLICLLISVYFVDEIAKSFQIHNKKKIFFNVLIYSGFFVARESMYNPVMTDSCSFMQICALYNYFFKNKISLFSIIFGISAFFTNPMPILIVCILGTFLKIRPNEIQQSKIVLPISILLFIFFNILFSGIIFRHQVFTMWDYPDNAIPIAIYFFNFFHSILFSFLFFLIFKHIDISRSISSLKKINTRFGLLFLFVILQIKLFQFIYPIKFVYSLGSTILVWSLFINMKPLIGLIDAVSYFGVVVLLYLTNIREINKFFYYRFGIGGTLVSLIGLAFLIKSESRHLLFFLPLMAIGVVNVISNFSQRFFIFSILTGFFLSKIWYPFSLAKFESMQFQQYPAQHYLAFLGPCLAWWPYYLFLGVFLLLFFVFYWLKSRDYFIDNTYSFAKFNELS